MRNYIIGLLTGILAGALFFATPAAPWYFWILLLAGSGLAAFGLDVFLGSFEENQPRAAWMGLALFGGPGAVLLAVVCILGL
jgi:hypothetical protein